MLQVARLAPNLLQEAADRVADFLRSQFNEDGGARDRAGKSDLYYTVFALEGLIALRQDPPADRVRPYLESFGDGEGLDFVHLTCLARCWAALGKKAMPAGSAENLAKRLSGNGSVYHQFLALGAFEDLGCALLEQEKVAASVLAMQSPDGSFGGTTPTTAGAVTLIHHLGAEVPASAVTWLLSRARPEGGFLAVPEAPVPDLLSTATALHALAAAHASIGALREPMLDFVDSLWTGKSFCGSWSDDVQDPEYTYYGLLALGHLSLS
jgi:prenyltransferase beta subunit